MKDNAYDLRLSVDSSTIQLGWKLDAAISNPEDYAYPSLDVQFSYTDIAQDTVFAMMRNLGIPRDARKAVMARVAA